MAPGVGRIDWCGVDDIAPVARLGAVRKCRVDHQRRRKKKPKSGHRAPSGFDAPCIPQNGEHGLYGVKVAAIIAVGRQKFRLSPV